MVVGLTHAEGLPIVKTTVLVKSLRRQQALLFSSVESAYHYCRSTCIQLCSYEGWEERGEHVPFLMRALVFIAIAQYQIGILLATMKHVDSLYK